MTVFDGERDRGVRPPVDGELAAVLNSFPADALKSVLPEAIEGLRRTIAAKCPTPRDLQRMGVIVHDVQAPARHGEGVVPLTILQSPHATGPRPCVYLIHGGGMIAGTRMLRLDALAEWVLEFGVTVVSVDYRLAPEHPFPAGIDDCYAGLTWIHDNAAAFSIDTDFVIVNGASAGGGLAFAVALMARDLGAPAISHLIVQCPMLDDRNESPSSWELDGDGPWDRRSNLTAWHALLGDAAGGPDTSPYAAPARAHDLGGLPPTYLDVGQVETFRDETLQFATRLSQAGVVLEFHLWPGAWHGFDYSAPHAAVSQLSNTTRAAYLSRAIDPSRAGLENLTHSQN
ncbi:alpha/beta hydrolase [Subtercola sp. YIM 133946]|uniref:alpha/beta hydrolase n=1 Tax=Subtercola sp. YIM 133946 TaxID=3118909 RepID=UPI002F91FC0E